jgi:uncharacterized protein YdeI (YjbR/CyaY-like superfamily)
MKIRKAIYLKSRKAWHSWLAKNYAKEKDIWLIYYKKASGKPRIGYNDAVEEALNFGWIDSTAKRIDNDSFAQRFSPRNPGSKLSELNKARIRKLIAAGQMTKFGLAAVAHAYNYIPEKLVITPDVQNALKSDGAAWKHFQAFPEQYRRIRIAYIEDARHSRPEEFRKRLRNFVRNTSKNRRIGFVKEFR